jgi:hypothetical protein
MTKTLVRIFAWSSIVALFVATDTILSLRRENIFTPTVDRFFALACVGMIFSMAYPNLLLVIGLLLASVVGFELLQRLIPDRHGFVRDMLVKGTGACIGIFIDHALRKLLEFFAYGTTANTK